jgi:hypothetical protein
LYSIDIKVKAFLRMDNPGKKELAACVKQIALVSSKSAGEKATIQFYERSARTLYIQ